MGKNIFQKIKEKVKDNTQPAIDRAKDKEKQIVSKIQETIKKIPVPHIEDIPYAPLLPMKKVMSDGLTAKGIKTDGSLHQIAQLFFKHYVLKNGMYQPSTTRPNGIVGNQNVSRLAITHRFNADTDATYTEEGSTASQYEKGSKETLNMIQKIVAWFKERKAKKKAEEDAKKNGGKEADYLPSDMQYVANDPATDKYEQQVLDHATATAVVIKDVAKAEVDADNEFSTVEIIITVVILAIIVGAIYKGVSGKPKKATT